MFGLFRRRPELRPEARSEARPEVRSDYTVTQSSAEFMQLFGLTGSGTSAGESVTIDSALGVPAVWAAVNFLSGTVAGLPLKIYEKTGSGPVAAKSPLTQIINGVANQDDMISSFDWLKGWMTDALTGGRGVSFVEKNAQGRIINLWPLDSTLLTIRRKDGRKVYAYKEANRKHVEYASGEVLDLPFMLRSDGLRHRSPILQCSEAIGMAQAITRHAGGFFRGGGIPPFVVTGNFQSGGAMRQAADDMEEASRKAVKEKRNALVLPAGLEIKSIGSDAEKSQMIETNRFIIEQIARIWSLPPVFLQDLTHGTFSNTEQQDLHLVKHTIKRWVEQIEQELTMKFFGRGGRFYVEFELSGLLRGDFKTRMEGYAQAIQNGTLTPNEARALENRQALPGGDRLMIQGATVPLETQGAAVPAVPAADAAPDAGQDDTEGADDGM